MQKMDILDAKSIHIYGWSFQISQCGMGVEEVVKRFKKSVIDWGWKLKDFELIDSSGNINKDAFMLKQYLSDSAEKIFLKSPNEEALCSIYEYPFDGNEYYYYIEKEEIFEKEGKEKIINKYTYKLPIEAIELHIYSCGIGALFFKTLNDSYPKLSDIKMINTYGRRMKIAYIPREKETGGIWADKLGIKVEKNGKEITSSLMDYKELICKIKRKDNKEDNKKEMEDVVEKISEVAGFLEQILFVRLSNKNYVQDDREDEYIIECYSDDRMFAISLIHNKELSEELKGFEAKDAHNEREEIEKLEEKIYSIIYMDSKGASCQNIEMRRKLLEKSLYTRWMGYGSLYGASSYSYVAITGEKHPDINESVVRSFYTEYLYLISLVLAQRIGIARFSYETTLNAENMNKGGWNRFWKSGNHIELQEKYVIFKSQMLVLEPSSQEQGIEIYKLLQEQLLVKEEQEILEEQVQSLFESISLWRGNLWTKIGFLGSLVVVIFKGIDKVFNELNGSYFFDYIAKIIATWIRN